MKIIKILLPDDMESIIQEYYANKTTYIYCRSKAVINSSIYGEINLKYLEVELWEDNSFMISTIKIDKKEVIDIIKQYLIAKQLKPIESTIKFNLKSGYENDFNSSRPDLISIDIQIRI